MLKQVMYVSRAVGDITTADIEEILQASQRYNAEHQITGLLVVKGRVFMQLLEGEEAEVAALFERIKADPRHEVNLYVGDVTEQRAFAKWSMGLKDAQTLSNEALLDLNKIEIASLSDTPTDVHAVLQYFLEIDELRQ